MHMFFITMHIWIVGISSKVGWTTLYSRQPMWVWCSSSYLFGLSWAIPSKLELPFWYQYLRINTDYVLTYPYPELVHTILSWIHEHPVFRVSFIDCISVSRTPPIDRRDDCTLQSKSCSTDLHSESFQVPVHFEASDSAVKQSHRNGGRRRHHRLYQGHQLPPHDNAGHQPRYPSLFRHFCELSFSLLGSAALCHLGFSVRAFLMISVVILQVWLLRRLWSYGKVLCASRGVNLRSSLCSLAAWSLVFEGYAFLLLTNSSMVPAEAYGAFKCYLDLLSAALTTGRYPVSSHGKSSNSSWRDCCLSHRSELFLWIMLQHLLLCLEFRQPTIFYGLSFIARCV